MTDNMLNGLARESGNLAIMTRPRREFVAWCLAFGLMMVGVGCFIDPLHTRWDESGQWFRLLLVGSALIAVRADILSRLPALVRQSGWMLLRPVIVWEFAGYLGLAAGIFSSLPTSVGLALSIAGAVSALVLARRSTGQSDERFPVIDRGFFLWTRGHFDDYSARRHVLAHLIIAGVTTSAWLLMFRSPPNDASEWANWWRWVLLSAGVGMLIPFLQVNPQRGLGFMHVATVSLVVASVTHAVHPSAIWPAALVAAAGALAFPGLTTALLMHVAPRQRRAALAVAEGFACAAAFTSPLLLNLPLEAARWLVVTAALSAFAFLLRIYFRECVEIVMEIVFWPMYRFQVTGPGLIQVPWRGPVLVLANHAAFFDPLFLGKYLPLRLRALMISTMFDRPFLKWLAGDVYGAIRVPDRAGFRRTMPELDEAIAVLRHGENLIIFPEGWLRRREDTPLHRFAQGVYRILSQLPQTPILPCWIETSWGSYLSYKNGPPAKNKPFDWFYKIVIAYGEPEIVPAEMLKDHKTARNYLMERVLHARTYLGLPAYPVPGLTSVEPDYTGPVPSNSQAHPESDQPSGVIDRPT